MILPINCYYTFIEYHLQDQAGLADHRVHGHLLYRDHLHDRVDQTAQVDLCYQEILKQQHVRV